MSAAPQIQIDGDKGSVSFPPAWNELDPITRTSILIGLIHELETAYHATMKGFMLDMAKFQNQGLTKQ
jgi:hypothetical protein